MPEKQKCPTCERAGLVKYLKSYQINLDEAVVLCENKLCIYPLSLSSSVTTFSRKLDDVISNKANESKGKVPDSQLALQTKVTSQVHKAGFRLQKDAVGIQTGSPQLKKKVKKNNIQHKKRETTATLHSKSRLNSCPPFQQQFGSQSFQAFKSFTETSCKPIYANEGQPWTGYNGSVGISDRDSLLNSSGDSLDSSSLASSNSSVVDSFSFHNNSSSTYEGFQFGESQAHHLPNSMSNISSLDSIFNGHSENIKNNKICDKAGSIEDVSHLTSVIQSEDRVNKVKETDLTIQKQNNLDNNSSSTAQSKVCTYKSTESLKAQIFNQFNNSLLKRVDKQRKACVDSHNDLLKYPEVFPQWRNKDALCWLDVILCLAVHNETLKALVFSDSFEKENLIYKLFKAHSQACKLIQVSESKALQHTGERCGTESLKVNDDVCDVDSKNISDNSVRGSSGLQNTATAGDLLNEVREEVWSRLKCRLKCEKGHNESPVFAFPLLLKENQAVEELFKMMYRFEYICSKCGKVENSDHVNTLPTFPRVVKDFNIGDPKHIKKCPCCGNITDTRNMVYKNLPECLLMHFTEGLPDTTFDELQFGFHGYQYTVTGLVQYINNPDHFIAWLRNPHDNTWFKCDDVGPTVCQKRIKEPKFPRNQIHIVMWERSKRKSKICRQVVVDKHSCVPGQVQTVAKKAVLNFNMSDLPESNAQHSKVGTSTALNILKHVNKLNEYFSNSDNKLKCSNTSVKVLESSPCSTVSAGSSDSVLLPNFVTFTTDSKDVLRPIPVTLSGQAPVMCNINTNVRNEASVPLKTKLNSSFECSEKSQGHKEDCLKDNLEASKSIKSDENKQILNNCQLNIPCSKISGPKGEIKPSTVFCVPKKSIVSHNIVPLCDVLKSVVENDKITSEETCVDGTKETKAMAEVKERNTNGTTDIVGDNNSKDLNNDSKNIDKEGEDQDTEGLKTVNRQNISSRLSQMSRFKVPFKLNKKACLSRDAFITLETNSKGRPESSVESSPVSKTSSPAFSGNFSYLNSVKQYLLTRTTGQADPKFKFEGLDLKSPSSISSFHMSGLPISSAASSVRSDVRSECNTPSNASDTLTTSYPSKTSELVNELIQRLEQSPFNQSTLKRKLEKTANKSPMKKVKGSQVDLDILSEGNASLKENTRNQRKWPGGKSMKLVRNVANQADKKNKQRSERTKDEPLELNNQMLNTKATKCDSDTVLQDLYEALNIPFSSVDATMTDIMTDVDDILGFVNIDDLVPSQRINSPLSCFEGSSAENQKHSECWFRRPDCNSAQREMSHFRITHLFLK